ncbi:hypothetical protein Syun_014522 [Stephania yunnanensis]|uniref:Uncharacterized protein n=1 Tax=Stephania yunnanensis TaxID=152371 RepID=A0AAP0JJP6_9MAGN
MEARLDRMEARLDRMEEEAKRISAIEASIGELGSEVKWALKCLAREVALYVDQSNVQAGGHPGAQIEKVLRWTQRCSVGRQMSRFVVTLRTERSVAVMQCSGEDVLESIKRAYALGLRFEGPLHELPGHEALNECYAFVPGPPGESRAKCGVDVRAVYEGKKRRRVMEEEKAASITK